AGDAKLLGAYNAAIGALKRIRDYHLAIAMLYHSARPACSGDASEGGEQDGAMAPLKGIGEKELAKFLKAVRDRTAAAVIES
ncbi:hypothetical protein C8R44DRAFT_627996, partial [Mycena epipterygia]